MTQPELTPRDHALRVAALEALKTAVEAEYEQARADATAAFKAERKKGIPQQEVRLPDDSKIGLISIKEGATVVTVDEPALVAWLREHNPEALEDYFAPSVLDREDVADVLRGVFPDAVSQRVRKATRAAYLKQAADAGGWLVDEESGVKTRVATIEKGDPTGDFAFAGGKSDQRRAAVMGALRTDPVLRAQLLGGTLALGPAAGKNGETAE